MIMKKKSLYTRIIAIIGITILFSACQPKIPTQTEMSKTPFLKTSTIPTSQLSPMATGTSTATITATQSSSSIPTKTVSVPSRNELKDYPKEGYGPTNFPDNINPLTGLPVQNPTILDRYPVAAKISIIPRRMSRPPWGISLADIVFDYYHNNGYTRFHAIFYGQDAELVGPIRSARLLDDTLIRAYKSIFAYGSADPRINRRLFNSFYSNRLALEGSTHTCPPSISNPFCRFDPGGSDILLIDTNALTEYMANKRNIKGNRQFLDGYYFNLTIPENGSPGKQIYTRYSGDSYSRWDYNASIDRYLRFQDNVYDQGQGEEYVPMVDRLTNEQVAADNVVVLFARHDYFYKTETSEIVDINLNGYGKAIVFRDGLAYKLNWARVKDGDIISLTYDDGSGFPLHPGITWFQVIGNSSNLSQDGSSWRFEFLIP